MVAPAAAAAAIQTLGTRRHHDRPRSLLPAPSNNRNPGYRHRNKTERRPSDHPPTHPTKKLNSIQRGYLPPIHLYPIANTRIVKAHHPCVYPPIPTESQSPSPSFHHRP